jgi:hypothetical protein
MAKPCSFADSPFALAQIDSEAIVLKMLEDFSNFAGMRIPTSVNDANIVEKLLAASEPAKTWDISLYPAGSWLESHWDASTSVFARRSDNDAHGRWFIIKDKGVLLQQNINLGEINIVVMALKDILQSRNRVLAG